MRFTFADFTLDADSFELKRGSRLVALEKKNFELLKFLLENRSTAVSKDDILAAIWPSVTVTDASLSTAIGQIRKALGDDGRAQKFIRTIHGFGFRFVAEVSIPGDQFSSAVAPMSPDVSAPDTYHTNRPTLAVLPFSLIGAEAQTDAIAEAIPAELIATLSRLRWIKIIARGSSFRFSNTPSDFGDVLSQLNATYVLTGTVEVQGDKNVIIVELTDCRTHTLVWAQSFVVKRDDVLQTRERIARDIVSVLEIQVPLNEADRLVHVPSENLDAWGHYHLGVRHMQSYSRKNNLIAEGHLKKALALDPSFARAEAALSYTEFQNHFQMFDTDTSRHRTLALQHAERAIAKDQLDPYCALNYGRAKWLYGEVEEAMVWAERALNLNPNYAFGRYNNAIFHNILCNAETAELEVSDALTLSPLDPHRHWMLATKGLATLLKGDDAEAVTCVEQALHAPIPHLYIFMISAIVFSCTGHEEKARACVMRVRERGVPFGSRDFLFHYNFRDHARRTKIEDALTQLGI